MIAIDDKDSTFSAYAQAHSNDLSRAALEKEISAMADKRNQEMMKTLQQKGATSRNIIYKKGSLEGAFLIFTTLGRT